MPIADQVSCWGQPCCCPLPLPLPLFPGGPTFIVVPFPLFSGQLGST